MSNPDDQLDLPQAPAPVPAQAELPDACGHAFLVLSEGFVELFLGGEIDLAIRDVLDRIVECAAEMGCPVVIDASAVTFADSTLVHMVGAFPDPSVLSLRRPEAKITDLLALAGIQLPDSAQLRATHSSGRMGTSRRLHPVRDL